MNDISPTAHRITVILGSVRSGRFGTHVGEWARRVLTESGADVDLVDLAELTIPADMDTHPDVHEFAERIERADAVIVITPEYNHSYPGPLKTAIDALRAQWRAKPVAFISYGGMAGGLRAVEALRLVFAELHAVTVRDTVSLHNPWGPASELGADYPGLDATEALHRMARQLLWWATAVRTTRDQLPYPA